MMCQLFEDATMQVGKKCGCIQKAFSVLGP